MRKIELLEFKQKLLELCHAAEIREIREKLLEAVLNHDIDFFAKFEETTDDSRDWLQALWQYYEADRNEKKQDYTPKSLCELVARLSGEANSIYDCCGGSGALTLGLIRKNSNASVYVEELDERVIPFLLFNLCIKNASGVVINGNSLTRSKTKCYKLTKSEKYSFCEETENANIPSVQIAVSNPPYNIKWEPPTPLEMDSRFPVIPPANNANWVFALNCLEKVDKAVLILPNGVCSQENEVEVRKYIVENDLLELVVIMPDKMFEITSISTCIIVLNKNKQAKGTVKFIDSRQNCVVEKRAQNGQFGGASHERRTYFKNYNVFNEENLTKILNAPNNQSGFSATVENSEIEKNGYILTPSQYIEFVSQEQGHRDFQEIADNINLITKTQNACKLVINETIAKNLGFDLELYKNELEGSKQLAKLQSEMLGIKILSSDYIQFTKNKNEFVFKCNDKELLPDILIHFLGIWKTQNATLNTLQEHYLAELRDALLPDLMSGKIEL